MPPSTRFLFFLVPAWMRSYRRQWMADDLLAGLLVALLALPQSLAYALLAGLPLQTGLYVSTLPAIAYAWVGSSMVQAVGPVAITAMMTFSVLQPLAPPGSPEYIQLAACLALMAGALLCAGSLLRLGFLSQLLSLPVIQGFVSGSALLIITSQLHALLGLPGGSSGLPALVAAAQDWRTSGLPPAAMVGLSSLAVLAFARLALGRVLERCGLSTARAAVVVRLTPILVIAAATAAVTALDLEAAGVPVVGVIQAGLPDFRWPVADTAMLGRLAVPALLMALVGLVQNISVAQALAIRRRERVDADHELMGLGAANLMAAVYGGMPVGGGISRSALNVAAGAQSPLATMVSAVVIAAIVVGMAAAFSHLPLAVLSAGIMIAAFSMVDFKSLRDAWIYDRADGLAWLGTAGGVVVLGLERGIELGILLSLAALLVRASTPHIARLGRIPGTEHFRNTDRHAVEIIPGVVFLRIDESLFFGNRNAVEARLAGELAAEPAIREVVLVMSAVNRVDATALEMLCNLNRDLSERGIRLHLAEVKGPVQDRLGRSRLWPALSGRTFRSVNDAYEALARERPQGAGRCAA